MKTSSVRDRIRFDIKEIQPLDRLEEAHQKDALTWIDSGAELCRLEEPATPPKHLIAYFAVVDGEHLLLVDHIKAKLWLPTGGHVDVGEHPTMTVMREAKEELGLAAVFLRKKPIFLTVTETVGKTAGHTDVSLWYVLAGERQQPLDTDDSEFTQVRWFHRDQLPLHRTDPHLKRFGQKLTRLNIW